MLLIGFVFLVSLMKSSVVSPLSYNLRCATVLKQEFNMSLQQKRGYNQALRHSKGADKILNYSKPSENTNVWRVNSIGVTNALS